MRVWRARAALLLVAIVATEGVAQQAPAPTPALRAIAVRRAQAEWERAESEWRRTAALRSHEMASAAELEERELARVGARLELVREALGALDEPPHLLIERAVRRPLPNGATAVTLTLRVAPALDDDLAPTIASLAPGIRAELARRGGPRAFVSLKSAPGADGVVIATPYEHIVQPLAHDVATRVTFRLVRDVADVVVAIDQRGRVEERRIVLESVGAALALQALQPAQEGDLGTQVAYELLLQRTGDGIDGARVVAEGLPDGVAWELREGGSDARLTLVRFAPGEREKRLRLLVALPSRATPGLVVDSSARFAVRASAGGDAASGEVGDARVALELLPRGVPRALLRVATPYLEVRAGERASVAATVHNDGTRVLGAVRVVAEAPAGWRARVPEPPAAMLAVGTDASVRVELTADAHAAPGDYELRLRLEGGSVERALETEPRIVRIRVREDGDGRALWLALLLAIAVAGALGWLGKRIVSR